jgi:hypothetical protein
MTDVMNLEAMLTASGKTPPKQLPLLAMLNLGVIESLANGLLSATEAVRVFFNAENCLFVHKRLHNKVADNLMSRGVQLPDLFEALPTEEAQREFQRELAAMRALSLKLLSGKQLVA